MRRKGRAVTGQEAAETEGEAAVRRMGELNLEEKAGDANRNRQVITKGQSKNPEAEEKRLQNQVQRIKSSAMNTNGKEEDLVESTFETDMLSLRLPDSHIPHMQIDGPTKKASSGCHHVGKPPPPETPQLSHKRMQDFFYEFRKQYNNNATGGVINYNIRAAYLTTRKKYANVWDSAAVMDSVSSTFVVLGTEFILEGNNIAASNYASLAYCFEQHIACNILKERISMNWPKINELFFDPDEHTLVSFFKKRITCSCLDAKYEQVRSMKKLGLCYNINCPHPGRQVKRSRTKCCSSCRRVNYCSRECQVENWNVHKQYC